MAKRFTFPAGFDTEPRLKRLVYWMRGCYKSDLLGGYVCGMYGVDFAQALAVLARRVFMTNYYWEGTAARLACEPLRGFEWGLWGHPGPHGKPKDEKNNDYYTAMEVFIAAQHVHMEACDALERRGKKKAPALVHKGHVQINAP